MLPCYDCPSSMERRIQAIEAVDRECLMVNCSKALVYSAGSRDSTYVCGRISVSDKWMTENVGGRLF